MELTEKTKLLNTKEEPKKFYFLNKTASFPKNNNTKESAPELDVSPSNFVEHEEQERVGTNWFQMLFGRRSDHAYQSLAQKPRKIPIKVEPKVFFANERTFLAWLHMAVTLASISIAIVAFAEANDMSQMYGLLMLPVSIIFTGYALYMYIKRSTMIRRKDPGPYEDKWGPTALSLLLATAIFVNFCIKIYEMWT